MRRLCKCLGRVLTSAAFLFSPFSLFPSDRDLPALDGQTRRPSCEPEKANVGRVHLQKRDGDATKALPPSFVGAAKRRSAHLLYRGEQKGGRTNNRNAPRRSELLRGREINREKYERRDSTASAGGRGLRLSRSIDGSRGRSSDMVTLKEKCVYDTAKSSSKPS